MRAQRQHTDKVTIHTDCSHTFWVTARHAGIYPPDCSCIHTYGCSVTGHNNSQVCLSRLWLYLVYFRLHLPLLTLFLTVLTVLPLALSFPNTQTSLWLNSTLTFYKMSQIQPPCQLLTYTLWSLLVYYTLNIHIQESTVQSMSGPLTSSLCLNDCLPLRASVAATRLSAVKHIWSRTSLKLSWHKLSN